MVNVFVSECVCVNESVWVGGCLWDDAMEKKACERYVCVVDARGRVGFKNQNFF